ncbi:c-type cytochrome [Rheinheimera sp. MM224]|uniref:c-type cytochrome n=1 Tax=Rheinheimera sp. MM224 TaxID=3019969 RepID=UPI0021F86E96|nr:cytochrome c [Rheinheimera sp. MM224]CAI3793829.1 Cytochrome c' [Rheinheimera sp. MM224]
MKNLFIFLSLGLSSAAALAGSAFTDAEDSVTYRQHSFQLIRHNFMDLSDMMRGKVPFDAKRAEKRADALAALTTLPWEAFEVPGADKIKSEAKAEIWKNLQDFQKKAGQFQSDALALQAAAKTGDQATIKPAFGNFAKNCKGCHEQYKAD